MSVKKSFTILSFMAFAVGAFAQNDTAYVTFLVNVDATVTAAPSAGTPSVVPHVQMSVSANAQTTMRIPLSKATGVINAASKQTSAPTIVNNGGGKVTLRFPSQSYKNAKIAMYSINGKQILRQKVSALSAANGVSRLKAAPGTYLLSVTETSGNKFTYRLPHRGGNLTLNMAFEGESIAPALPLAKGAAAGDWTITVAAVGYGSMSYGLTPVEGTDNPQQNITLRPTVSGATYTVTVVGGGYGWSGGGDYAAGETVTINAGTPSVGLRFAKWWTTSDGVLFENERAAITTFSMPANDITVTATVYILAGYYFLNVYANQSNRGTVTRYPVQDVYASGASVTVTANAADGYEFSFWNYVNPIGGAGGDNWDMPPTDLTNPVTIVMNEDAILEANFKALSAVEIVMFTDARDGKVYKSVKIGNQTWMAENLNYQTTSGSWCYGDKQSNCDKYGRLYDWNTAMAGALSSTATPSGVQGVCPSGWHLPSRVEWDTLVTYVGGSSVAGKKLKSVNGWDYEDISYGTDEYGFSALPGGNRYSGGSFSSVGYNGDWWTATVDYVGSSGWGLNMNNEEDRLSVNMSFPLGSSLSVRCVGD